MTAQELIDNSILKFVGKTIKHIKWDIHGAIITFTDETRMVFTVHHDVRNGDIWLNIN